MTCCSPVKDASIFVAEESQIKSNITEQRLRANCAETENGWLQIVFAVPDMHCAACINKIEKNLAALDFVEDVRANLSLKCVSVKWNPFEGTASLIADTLGSLGFEYSVEDQSRFVEDAEEMKGKQLLMCLAVAGFAFANIMLLSVSVWSGADAATRDLFHLISGIIAVPAVLFSGRPFFRSAIQALAAKRLNMDVPISLAVLLALGMSIYESLNSGEEAYFDAAVALLFFLLIGRYLDQLVRGKARQAAKHLSRLTARGATRICDNGKPVYVPLESIAEGMRLQILPGERFPVNVKLSSSSAEIDRSIVTGESNSVKLKKNDDIEAGALNLSNTVEVMALGTAENSFLAEMQKMMSAAEKGRGQYVRIADRAARIYAPAVHLLAAISFVFK